MIKYKIIGESSRKGEEMRRIIAMPPTTWVSVFSPKRMQWELGVQLDLGEAALCKIKIKIIFTGWSSSSHSKY